ncbi:MAG TPA: LAGLIDADG family homing endonuclease, partial [Nitrososphaerales archaeon]|nr:LAGLIDADG family homing endonuclease [Nitrososphaerales archaeon]
VDIRGLIQSKFGKSMDLATIKGWVAGAHSPYGRVYRLPEEPIPELAYLIGVNYGDTSRSKGNWHHNYTVRLRVKDEDFAREFARAASVVLGKTFNAFFDKKRTLWQSDVCSMLLYHLLTKPLSKLKPIVTHCKDCVASFVRAFFDAEGSVGDSGLTASNGNLELLGYVQRLLVKYFKVRTTGPHKHGSEPGTQVKIRGRLARVNLQNYVIYVRSSSLKKFYEYVGFTIVRKRESLRRLVESRPSP